MKSRRVLVVIMLAVAFCGLIVTRRVTSQNEAVPSRPYTLVAMERLWDADGKLRVNVITYEVAADGSWVATRERSDNKGDIKKERITQGADYQVSASGEKEGKRLYFAEQGANELRVKFRSASFLTQHKEFVGTENVCGLVGYVLKGYLPNVGENERTFTPETGYLAVRAHRKLLNGVEYRLDPVSITFH